MFAILLYLSIILSYFCSNYAREEIWIYRIIFLTQLFCCMNLYFLHKGVQQFLHDCFVYVLVYGLMTTNNLFTKVFSCCVSTAMVSTRFYYKSCIFLWWNTNRNPDYDMIVMLMTLICLLRSRALIPNWLCFIVGVVSHFLEDAQNNSITVS